MIAGINEENITGIGTIFQSWGTAPDGLRKTMKEFTFSFGTEFQYREFLFTNVLDIMLKISVREIYIIVRLD